MGIELGWVVPLRDNKCGGPRKRNTEIKPQVGLAELQWAQIVEPSTKALSSLVARGMSQLA